MSSAISTLTLPLKLSQMNDAAIGTPYSKQVIYPVKKHLHYPGSAIRERATQLSRHKKAGKKIRNVQYILSL